MKQKHKTYQVSKIQENKAKKTKERSAEAATCEVKMWLGCDKRPTCSGVVVSVEHYLYCFYQRASGHCRESCHIGQRFFLSSHQSIYINISYMYKYILYV